MTKHYKIVLVGSSGVGKTSIMLRLTKNKFNIYNEATIGSSYYCLKKTFENDEDIEFQIWDTAGQERYRSLINMYLRGCHAIMLVYDTSESRFDELNFWVKYIRDSFNDVENKPLLYLIGNKSDLLESENKEEIMDNVINNLKIRIPIEKHELVSAKSGSNVQNIFFDIIETLVKSQTVIEEKPQTIIIEESSQPNTYMSYCCKYM